MSSENHFTEKEMDIIDSGTKLGSQVTTTSTTSTSSISAHSKPRHHSSRSSVRHDRTLRSSQNQFRVERRMLENQESYQRMTIEREWKMLWDLIDDQATHVLELIRSEERRRAAWLIVSREREQIQKQRAAEADREDRLMMERVESRARNLLEGYEEQEREYLVEQLAKVVARFKGSTASTAMESLPKVVLENPFDSRRLSNPNQAASTIQSAWGAYLSRREGRKVRISSRARMRRVDKRKRQYQQQQLQLQRNNSITQIPSWRTSDPGIAPTVAAPSDVKAALPATEVQQSRSIQGKADEIIEKSTFVAPSLSLTPAQPVSTVREVAEVTPFTSESSKEIIKSELSSIPLSTSHTQPLPLLSPSPSNSIFPCSSTGGCSSSNNNNSAFFSELQHARLKELEQALQEDRRQLKLREQQESELRHQLREQQNRISELEREKEERELMIVAEQQRKEEEAVCREQALLKVLEIDRQKEKLRLQYLEEGLKISLIEIAAEKQRIEEREKNLSEQLALEQQRMKEQDAIFRDDHLLKRKQAAEARARMNSSAESSARRIRRTDAKRRQEEFARQSFAATKIQATFRGFRVRQAAMQPPSQIPSTSSDAIAESDVVTIITHENLSPLPTKVSTTVPIEPISSSFSSVGLTQVAITTPVKPIIHIVGSSSSHMATTATTITATTTTATTTILPGSERSKGSVVVPSRNARSTLSTTTEVLDFHRAQLIEDSTHRQRLQSRLENETMSSTSSSTSTSLSSLSSSFFSHGYPTTLLPATTPTPLLNSPQTSVTPAAAVATSGSTTAATTSMWKPPSLSQEQRERRKRAVWYRNSNPPSATPSSQGLPPRPASAHIIPTMSSLTSPLTLSATTATAAAAGTTSTLTSLDELEVIHGIHLATNMLSAAASSSASSTAAVALGAASDESSLPVVTTVKKDGWIPPRSTLSAGNSQWFEPQEQRQGGRRVRPHSAQATTYVKPFESPTSTCTPSSSSTSLAESPLRRYSNSNSISRNPLNFQEKPTDNE